MERSAMEELWSETLTTPTLERFDRLAQGMVDVYASADVRFRQHMRNCLNRVTTHTGKTLDPENFDLETAQAYIADEVGFGGWDQLTDAVSASPDGSHPILFRYAIAAMDRGDFSAFEMMIGGPEQFHTRIVEWGEQGLFDNEQETLDEILSAACMLGQTKTAEYLIDKGVDPYAGMRTGLAGPHYAVSSGRPETVKMLLGKGISMEVENRYGGTLLGQALWSAINEYTGTHPEIIERLIEAGAHIWPGTLEWWEEQEVSSLETKRRVAEALRNAG